MTHPSTRAVVGSLSNEVLHLVLLPTEACNFRCVYCYEDFNLKRMGPEVVEGVKRLLSRRAPELTELHLSWFGGEPLLACDIIEDILLHVDALRRAERRMAFTSDMTTNGYLLTRSRLGRLMTLGVSRFQVSFDGPPELHDRKRVLAGGGGTFERIWGNLVSLRSAEGRFNVIVRLHVDRENQDELPRFIDMFQEAFGSDARFQLFMRPLSCLGGPNDDVLPVLSAREGDDVIGRLRRMVSRAGVSEFVPGGAGLPCHAARANSFVVRADGSLNKCTVALASRGNHVGRLRGDGTVEIDAQKISAWIRGVRSGIAQELACPLRGLPESRPDRPQPSGTER